jgi:hypothetical protein
MQGYIDQVARPAKQLLASYGVRKCRALTAVVAGEATGSVVFITELDDLAATGAVLDRVMADPQATSLLATGSESPMASYQTTIWVDIPLGGPSGSDLTPDEEIAALESGG